jgi:hypothetical protein
MRDNAEGPAPDRNSLPLSVFSVWSVVIFLLSVFSVWSVVIFYICPELDIQAETYGVGAPIFPKKTKN